MPQTKRNFKNIIPLVPIRELPTRTEVNKLRGKNRVPDIIYHPTEHSVSKNQKRTPPPLDSSLLYLSQSELVNLLPFCNSFSLLSFLKRYSNALNKKRGASPQYQVPLFTLHPLPRFHVLLQKIELTLVFLPFSTSFVIFLVSF